jgi:formate hydrogenlyase transcriptional activator
MITLGCVTMDLTKLSNRIRLIRERHHLSKAELSRRLEISTAYVTELESGQKTTISTRLARVVSYELGVSREWLLEGKGEPFLSPGNRYPLYPDAAAGQTKAHTGDLSAFERLLSEISAKYINLSGEELEKVLQRDFQDLSRFLKVDVCILYIGTQDSGVMQSAKPLVWRLDENQKGNKPLCDWLAQDPVINENDYKHIFQKWNRNEPTLWGLVEERVDDEEIREKETKRLNYRSALAVPIQFAGYTKGALTLATTDTYRTWPDDLIPRLRLFGEVFINALMRKQSEGKLRSALSEINKLKERLEKDYEYLKEEINLEPNFSGIVGKSDVLKKILLKVKQVAPTNSTVLILGETGTGKGLIAREIHNASSYKDRPLVQVNCATLTPSLVESELFGHEKGAFTGAASRRMGRFEAAQGTTLFLDEIGDLPLELQPKLLRVLEEGEFERVGGSATIHTDVRLIAATSRDLEKEVKAGRFRRDLLYRLNIFPIFVPPLRARLDDVPLFVAYFVDRYGKWAGKKFDTIPLETVRSLQGYSWPGNIRELKNMIERAVIMSPVGNLQIEIPKHGDHDHAPEPMKSLREIEREAIIRVLEQTHWKINGQGGAAQYLDIHPATLRSRMKKLNIKRSSQTSLAK